MRPLSIAAGEPGHSASLIARLRFQTFFLARIICLAGRGASASGREGDYWIEAPFAPGNSVEYPYKISISIGTFGVVDPSRRNPGVRSDFRGCGNDLRERTHQAKQGRSSLLFYKFN